METEQINIKHNFADDEKVQLGEQQAELLGKKDELEAQLKSARTQIQAQVDACEAEIRGISSKLRSRYEFRNQDCLILDHRNGNGTRHIVRIDTGHVVKSRKLRADESQVKITDKEPDKYVAIGLFPVDDHAIDADFIDLHVFDDEFEALRKCADVKFRDVPKRIVQGKRGDK